MSTRHTPERFFEAGFTDLVSVIPPSAKLTPRSTINAAGLGKTPGHKTASGLWAGYDWRKHQPSLADVTRWCLDGASTGLRADRWPGVDIDCTDESLAKIIEDVALGTLGPAPIRTGRAPKRLLMYHTPEPFGRMRLYITKDGAQHLVEILGAGQQYLVHGTHPVTMKPYVWDRDPVETPLTTITKEQASAFLAKLEDSLNILSIGRVERVGDGRVAGAVVAEQSGLLAPSIERLHAAVSVIPNDDRTAPGRDEYVRMGYAIRAAGGEDEEEAYGIFADWASRHAADGRVGGNPETWRSDWRRMKPPFALGWEWIASQARSFGFVDATDDFDATAQAPSRHSAHAGLVAFLYSEQWLAAEIATKLRSTVRYSPERKCWIVWDGSRWEIDAALAAEDHIKLELRAVADIVARGGGTAKEAKDAASEAKRICSTACLNNVMSLVKSDRSIVVTQEALDFDLWKINTPAGLVDLKTGMMQSPDPDALCTKRTAVAPDSGMKCNEWRRFLMEACGGDVEMVAYLQRLAGYVLTGTTREQQLTFIWGQGGNGKSVFLNILNHILGDYAVVATMETFTASHGDKHTTDLAMLAGARFVSASENAAGKRWDEARVKSITGGEKVSARFMRQNNFTFEPQFKLIFVGNHKPEIRDIDKAMRRRVHLVPFTVTPKTVDMELGFKLKAEAPAILAWMIEGCLAWQQHGLAVPARVKAATEEYFETEDDFGRWLEECVTPKEGENVLTSELFQSWTEWTNANGGWRGSAKRLSSLMLARGFNRWRHPENRRAGFSSIEIINRQDLGILG